MSDREPDREPSEVVETLSAIGGALAGTALTFVAGPFVGSASGEALARVLLRVGTEIERKWLAPRQQRRIGEAATAAYAEVGEQLEAGREVRTDGFFDPATPDGESPADELFEGVLRTAADEWEQRKVPYIGRIFAGLAFDASVSPAEGSYLIKLSERLTYQQVALLALWAAAEDPAGRYGLEVSAIATTQTEGGGQPAPTLIAEMDDLAQAGLLGIATDQGVAPPAAIWAGTAGFRGIDLYRVRLTDLGHRLHRLMGLQRIPDGDMQSVLSALRAGDRPHDG